MKRPLMELGNVKSLHRHRIRNAAERGSVLLLSMGFLLLMTVTIASLLSWSGTETIMVSRRTAQVDSMYGAEAAIRRGMAQVRKLYFEGYSSNSYYTGSMAAPSDAQIAALTSGAGPSTVSALNNFTYTNMSIAFTSGTSANRYTTNAIAANDETLSAYAGLTSQRATIVCQTQSTALNRRFQIPSRVKQTFNIDYIPVFQYAVFYNMDMEVFNGPALTINGKVHANGTLYYAPAATLTIQSALTSSGNIYRGIKLWNSSKPKLLTGTSAATQAAYGNSQVAYEADGGNWSAVDPTSSGYGEASFLVKNPVTGSLVDFQTSATPTYYDSASSGWAGGALTRWGGGVKSKDQGIDDVTPPVPDDVISAAADSTNPYHTIIEAPVLNSSGVSTESGTTQSAKMAYNATLIIQRTGTNVIFRVKDATTGAYHQVNLRDASTIVPTATTTVRDQREYLQNGNVKMTVTDFNIAAFYGDSNADGTIDANHGAMDTSGNWIAPGNTAVNTDTSGNSFTPKPFDGTVYIYDDNYSSTRKPAIRIKNGAKIFDRDSNSDTTVGSNGNLGLSIISENPVYVQGNFNADGTTTTGPEKTGGSKETVPPAMIAADVLSVLSTSWDSSDDDPASSTSYYGRSASSNTEINAAILAGVNRSSQDVVASSFDGTTGGVNNFPRFMENWSSTFKYSGSMVSLWYGKQSTSTYKGAGTANNVFSAPTRDWAFNTDFMNPNQLPRSTPIIRVYTTSNWTLY